MCIHVCVYMCMQNRESMKIQENTLYRCETYRKHVTKNKNSIG